MNLQGRYVASQEENQELRRRLEEAGDEATPRELLIEELHEKSGRRRKLTPVQYGELTNNLKNNPLVTPITVRKMASGGYEIVSGNNRVQIYRELGRPSIFAAVIDADDEQSDLNAFYANLLHSDLPDFEKFLGFLAIEQRYPDRLRTQIALNAGVSPSTVTQLMSYAALPEEALIILREQPDLLGANAAQDMAKLCKLGKEARVCEAIGMLRNKGIDQAQAVRFAHADPMAKPRARANQPVRIKSGKEVYCEMLQADKVMRLVFQTGEDATAAQAAIRAVIEKLAGKKVEEP
jgi:ParB family chromosome partitioning protein